MLGFFVLLVGIVSLAVPSFADEVDSIGPTLTRAVDDVEDWLVQDSPIQISRPSIERVRERVGDEARNLLRSSSDTDIADRATIVAEVITGSVLALILTFFMLRDGRRFVDWCCAKVDPPTDVRLRRSLQSAWATLAGYLKGATMLGALESVLIGLTLWIAGGGLVGPVMIVTFLGAYVPLIGAVVTGCVAVLVALVTGGTGAAIAVAVVALLVQQFDNDLLAPVIYGRALNLHPVVILLGVVAGGALFGVVGTVLAVPVIAVAVNASKAFRHGPADVARSGSAIP
jgi:predicted PurR-regulated permease PerM